MSRGHPPELALSLSLLTQAPSSPETRPSCIHPHCHTWQTGGHQPLAPPQIRSVPATGLVLPQDPPPNSGIQKSSWNQKAASAGVPRFPPCGLAGWEDSRSSGCRVGGTVRAGNQPTIQCVQASTVQVQNQALGPWASRPPLSLSCVRGYTGPIGLIYANAGPLA